MGIIEKINTRLKEKINSSKDLIGLRVVAVDKKIILGYKTSKSDKNMICLAISKNGFDFDFFKKDEKVLAEHNDFSQYKKYLKFKDGFFKDKAVEIEGVVETAAGKLIVFHSITEQKAFRVGMVLVSKLKKKIVWYTDKPIWETPTKWLEKETKFIDLVFFQGKIIAYWNIDNKEIFATIYPAAKIRTEKLGKTVEIKLDKHKNNPLISPNSKNAWEAFTTFNPAAIYEGGKVHILYRAQGFNYVSVVGYASSSDGITIEERSENPIYIPREPFEFRGKTKPKDISSFYCSGGGYGGVEDPRITRVEDRIYMTYVAYDGASPPRVALTSISVDDFLNRRWLWEKPVLISPPGVVDKSCVIFPEKVNGKYVVMHRIFPNILVDYVDSLNFNGKTWLKGQYKIPPRLDMWDSRKIGAGAPPIKTEDGWLLIYQSVDDRDDSKYLIGAMLLDLNNPEKVICRSKVPILRPIEDYENVGFKAGVVYPCGAVVIDETLFVYYGGADSYVCVATANLKDFLSKLKHDEEVTLEPAEVKKVRHGSKD